MQFSECLKSIAPMSDGTAGFSARIGSGWSQGRATFGGLVGALGNEAMRRLVPADRALRGLEVTFVGPAVAGTVHLHSELLRVGRAVTIASARVISDGQIAATLTGIYGAARSSALSIAPPPPGHATPVEQLPAPFIPPAVAAMFVQHFDLRWAQGTKPFAGTTLSSSKAYIRHRDTAALTESHVVALIDGIWAPALQLLKSVAQSSSLTWRLEFLRHNYDFPLSDWWRIDTRSNAAGEGYVSQSSVVFDPSGAPAAFSHQLVAVFG